MEQHGIRCACCNNPWNPGDSGGIGGEDSALSKDLSSLVFCLPCLNDDKGVSGIFPGNIDHTVNLKENFYLWSNGNWKKQNPIPGEYSSWGTFIALRDMNLDRLKVILDDLQAGTVPLTGENKKLADFFNSMMDEVTINARGMEPLNVIFELISTTVDSTRAQTIISLQKDYGMGVLFSKYSSPDKSNANHSLLTLTQGGLGLPDRDYYFDEDKTEKRDKYIKYIEELLAKLPDKIRPANPSEAAAKVYEMEVELAGAHWTKTVMRDPEKTFNKMSIAALQRLTGDVINFDWQRYFAQLVGRDVGDVNVATPEYIKKAVDTLTSCNVSTLQTYLIFHVLNALAPHLSKDIVQLHFNFYEKELKGTVEQKPRWKQALSAVEDSLGEAMGQLYTAKHFNGDAKKRALTVVENVRDALKERLGEVEWMSESTRAEAMNKMSGFRVKIGFPNKWIDYTNLSVEAGKHLENVLSGRKFNLELDMSRVNKETDRERWFMTPQTVNAYYHPSLNEIVFPAAILQPPFFDPNADEPVNYGSLGAVVGHEMTHGFDDSGRKYDSQGTLRDWWEEVDGLEYERRVEVMVKQAEQFQVHGVSLKGKLTCGENIADLGGLKLAYRALKAAGGLNADRINGFTPQQRFFMAWSQVWRENSTKERALQLVTLDPHGPNELRANGPLSNITEFYEAFGIDESDPMYKPQEQRVDIW